MKGCFRNGGGDREERVLPVRTHDKERKRFIAYVCLSVRLSVGWGPREASAMPGGLISANDPAAAEGGGRRRRRRS